MHSDSDAFENVLHALRSPAGYVVVHATVTSTSEEDRAYNMRHSVPVWVSLLAVQKEKPQHPRGRLVVVDRYDAEIHSGQLTAQFQEATIFTSLVEARRFCVSLPGAFTDYPVYALFQVEGPLAFSPCRSTDTIPEELAPYLQLHDFSEPNRID